MDIYELDSYRLSDAVKFHTELNPALWDGKKMRPEVREALLKIADDFKTFMGIDDLALEDITVSGSNAAFSYTPHSDIDLHLLVDFSKLNPDEVYQELFNAKKYQYNDTHDIKIRGYDVELYVQDSNKPVRSLGEYSLVKDDWTRIPVQRRGNLDEKSTQSKYEKLKGLIELATNSDSLEQVTAVTDTIKKYRQAGLDEHGEFGPENLAYKMLRTQGYVERLFKHKADLEDARLSLAERKKKKKKKKTFRYGSFGGYYYPGYGYYGQTDAATDGGGDGGGESVKESTVSVQKKEIPLDQVVRRFVHFAAKYLKLKQLPKIKLKKGELSHNIHSMGHYVDDDKTVEVETKDRHVMDILRTLAHELTHYRQHQRLGKSMPDSAGRTGSPYENEANAEAGVVMRHFQNKYPEFFASTVSEAHEGTMREVIRKMLPGWPDYVIKDWISSRVKDQPDLNNLKGWLGELNKQVVPNSWQLHQKMPLTFDMLNPRTRYFMKTKRQFGERNPFLIPRDRERLESAMKLVQEKGMDNLPPVIMLQHANGLELCEGWHRTMAAFRLHPEGFQINAWIAKANETVAEDGESVNAQYGDQTPPGPESPPTMPAGTLKVDVTDMYDWYKIGQHISNMKGLGRHDFGAGPPSSIISFGDEETEHKFIQDLAATGLDVTDIDPKDPNQPPTMRKIKTDPTYNVNEFAPGKGGDGDGGDGSLDDEERKVVSYAQRWFANPNDHPRIRSILKLQGYTVLSRGWTHTEIAIKNDKTGRKMYFFDPDAIDPAGPEFGTDLNEGLGKTLATGALAAAAALGQPAQAQDTGRIAYQIGKQIYQPSGIFTRAGAEEEIKGIARDMARGSREIRVGGRLIFGGPPPRGERVAANASASTPEEAYRQALENAINRAQQQYGTIILGQGGWKVTDYDADQLGNTYRAVVAIEGPAPRREDRMAENASGYIPTKKQARDPRYKTALTVDIKPGQLGKEANKLGLQTDSQGRPDLLMKNLANALKEYKESGNTVILEGFNVGDVIDLTPNYSAFNKLHGEIQGTGADGKLRIKIVNVEPANKKISVGTVVKVAPNYVKRSRVVNEDQELVEVKMSPSALEAWANSPEAEGIRAGFEAEMIFRDTKRDEDEGEMEPDYDYDERPDDIDHVIDFFSNDDWGYGLSTRGARDLRESLWEEYHEWVQEQIDEEWDAEEQVKDYMDINVWDDDSEREERINSVLERNDIDPDEATDQQKAQAEETAHDEYLEEVEEAANDSSSDYYQQAYEYYSDMKREGGEYDERDFLRDRYGYMSEIANSQSLDWPYWTGGGSGGGERDWSDIGDSLERTVGMEVKVGSGYHSTKRTDDRWIIEPDGSLDPDDSDDMGLEIVSPPMPLPETLEKLKAVIEWGNNEADAYTNSSTGLHMGISIPYVGGDVDYVKLVLFMGDEYILDKFGRASNTYAASAMGKLRQNMAGARNRGELTEAKLDPMGALQLVQKNLIELAARYVQNGVGTSKYTSAHIKDGYIEFRSPGGDYLSMESRGEYDDIRNTMLRFARAMQIAGNPSLERQEYAKKLYKLISPGAQDDGLKLFSQFAAGTITPEQLKKQWADAVLQKEIPTTGKEEYEVYRMDNNNSPDGIVGTFYAQDYDSAHDQFLRQYGRDINNLDFRIKQPWFDVYDEGGNVIATLRARDIDQAKEKAKANNDGYFLNTWKIYRRPDNTPEPEKKLSRRAQVAKRLKEPKVSPAVAADNAQDSKEIQARIGEPRPAGAVGDTGHYRVTWRELRGGGLQIDSLNIDAANGNAAMDRVRSALQAQGREIIGIEAHIQDPPAWRQQSQSTQETFSGEWQVRDSDTNEVLYTFSGVGNNQGDANRVAARWLQQNAPRGSDMTDVTVVPVMR